MKILFTDLDETLLNKESKVTEYTCGVLKEFTDAGNLIVPASGRPLLSVQKLVASSGLSDVVRYIVAYNGALVWDNKKSSVVWSATVPSDCARIIQDTGAEMGIHTQTYANEHVFTAREDEEIKVYTSRIFVPVIYTDDPVGTIDCEPYKLLAIHLSDVTKLEALKDRLTPLVGDRIDMVFSNPMYLEFFSNRAGKGSALTELCNILGISKKDSYAAGDEENDISMIKAAGCGIAMKNAIPSVLSCSDAVTDFDNSNDGLARFIKDHIMN